MLNRVREWKYVLVVVVVCVGVGACVDTEEMDPGYLRREWRWCDDPASWMVAK